VLKSARPSARSVLIILLHGTAALQNDLSTAKRLKARAVLNPAAHAHTDQVMTVQLAIGLTGQAATDPPVIDPTVQAVTALTGLVVIGGIHQEPIVRLAQKPNVHIAQAATDLLVTDLTGRVEIALLATARIRQEPIVRLAQKPNVLIVQAATTLIDQVVIVLLVTGHIPQELIVPLAQKPSAPINHEVIAPQVIDLTVQAATVQVATNHTAQLATVPIHPEPIMQLAQKPSAPINHEVIAPQVIDLTVQAVTAQVATDQLVTDLTARVVTARIHQELIVPLEQKPNVRIAQAVIALPATDLTGQAVIARAARENLTLKEMESQVPAPVITRKAVLPRPNQRAVGPILPTGTLQAGAAARVLPDQARITRRYPSNAPSPRRING